MSQNDQTPKVTGIGGIFFFTENPKETSAWYAKHLGLETNDYGCSFESRNFEKPEEVNILQWSPFKQGSAYFAPSNKEFMINYRVQNIEGLIEKLKAEKDALLGKKPLTQQEIKEGAIVEQGGKKYRFTKGKYIHID
jgi:hypothetical protein